MDTSWTPVADAVVADLREVFGDRLLAVVAYGPTLEGVTDVPFTSLALVTTLTGDDLEVCARLAGRWQRAQVATPLLLSEDEFLRSLDIFPLEYGEIIRQHALLYGTDPFATAVIAPADLRHACELQAKSHLVHLREAFIESGGAPKAVAELVSASAPAFTALLRNVARLNGVTTDDRMALTHAGGRAAGLPDALVADMLGLERHPAAPGGDGARVFPEYLAAVEQLARAVDEWRA